MSWIYWCTGCDRIGEPSWIDAGEEDAPIQGLIPSCPQCFAFQVVAVQTHGVVDVQTANRSH